MRERLLRPYNLDHMLRHLDKDKLRLHHKWAEVGLLLPVPDNNLVGCMLLRLVLVLELDHHSLRLRVLGLVLALVMVVPQFQAQVPRLPLELKRQALRRRSTLLVTEPIFLIMQSQRLK